MRLPAGQRVVVVVGADLSVNHSALVAVRGKRSDVAHEVLATRSMNAEKLRGMRRLDVFDEWVARFYDDLVFRGIVVDFTMFEGPGFASQVAHMLGGVHALAKLRLWRRGMPMGEVAPGTLKKFCAGHGHAEKNTIMKWVFKRWAFDSDDDNECDAFGCAMVGLCHLGGGTAVEQKTIAGKVTVYEGRGAGAQSAAQGSDRAEDGQVAGRVRRRRVA